MTDKTEIQIGSGSPARKIKIDLELLLGVNIVGSKVGAVKPVKVGAVKGGGGPINTNPA